MLKINMAILTLAAASAVTTHAATVVLDTGHSPQRSGSMSASGKTEYAYNLQMSTYVSEYLAKHGITVIRVAADGKDIALKKRTAATDMADLFLSIHHDSIQQEWIDQGRRRDFDGFSTFVSAKNPDYSFSLACAKRIGAGMRAAGERPSLYHAEKVKGENRPLVDRQYGVHQFDDLVVLKMAKTPAVLLEVGVIANPEEEVRLATAATALPIARAIADAVVNCLSRN